MKQAILDTSFILTAVRNKIDFLEELAFMSFKVFIPKQVVEEIKKVSISDKRFHFKNDAKLALKLIKCYSCKALDIGKGHVDDRLFDYANKNREVVIGTIDKELMKRIKNPKIIIRNKKQLQLIS